ncbi:MAG: hypothetical protein RLZ51_1509, partial [Pseudomonadota bacterium]
MKSCFALIARALSHFVLLVVLLAGAMPFALAQAPDLRASEAWIAVSDLPPEARRTLDLIRGGGPFPYEKDGTVFGNRERLLPRAPRGHYTEYTVRTPGVRHRGARRIVTGGDPRSP